MVSRLTFFLDFLVILIKPLFTVFTKITEKYLVHGLFLIKLQAVGLMQNKVVKPIPALEALRHKGVVNKSLPYFCNIHRKVFVLKVFMACNFTKTGLSHIYLLLCKSY